MRIAIFSDVHGNLTALEAILTDIKNHTVDAIFFAGDLCLAGPRPAACLQRVREAEITAVYGNTDDWLLGRQTPPQHLQALAQWTHDQLNQDQRDWLDTLPFSHHLSPTNQPKDDLLILHANPQDVNQLIFPPEAIQMAQYGRIRQPDTELTPLLNTTTCHTIAYGHLHIPNIRHWQRVQLVNISSVSMPGDGDPRAKYALLTWQNNQWHAQHHRVSYPIAPEITAFQNAQPPGWERVVATMQQEGTFPQKV